MTKPPRCTFAELPHALRTHAAGCKVVAFDVFDTLLLRHVAADDVKELCAREFARALGRAELARTFYSRRRALERELCEESERRGGDFEFRHADLIRRWVDECAEDVDTEPIRGALSAFELDREQALTTPAPVARDALQTVQDLGLRAIWICDHYLPASAIDALLAAHGLNDLLAQGYVSSTDRHTKRSGRLYVDVSTRENVHADQLLMVGDDRHADLRAPQALGIKTLWLHDEAARQRRRILAAAHAAWRRDAKFAGPRLATSADQDLDAPPPAPAAPERELGELLAAVFVAFTLDVLEQARERSLSRVLFLSPGGATLHRLYGRLARALAYDGAPKAIYLCASRRATLLASLTDLEPLAVSGQLSRRGKRLAVTDALAELGLDAPRDGIDFAAIAAEHGLDRGDVRVAVDDARWLALLADPRTQTALKKSKIEAHAALRSYARARGLLGAKGAVGLVGIGWRGSVQSQLVAALANDRLPPVHGFYLALAGGDDDGENSKKRAYLYDHRRDPRVEATLLENSRLFELFAAARHGAILGYTQRGKQWRPRLAAAPEADAAVVARVRSALFARADRLCRAVARLRPTAAELRPWLLDELHRFVRYPSRAQAEAFASYGLADNGNVRGARRSWARIMLGGAPWNIPARAQAAFADREWPGAALRLSRLPGLNWLYDRYRRRHGE